FLVRQALLRRHGDEGDDRRCPDLRRLRVHEGVPGREADARREAAPDLRGHVADPARRDRAEHPRRKIAGATAGSPGRGVAEGAGVFGNMFIGIAGMIGAGKSTLAAALGQHLGIDTYYEPVADNEYLADFYRDTPRYSLARQVYLLTRRFQQHQEIIWRGRSAVQDRTIYEDSIFAKMLAATGLMDERDYR